ncbi:MAG: tetratricopeptide repeat protein [Methanothrix sp.]|nr:tetratricopeptide repeat protein [Methanothrix sp.]
MENKQKGRLDMKTKISLLMIIATFWFTTCAVAANMDMDSLNIPANENANAHKYITKGIEYYKLGSYEEAIKCYDMAIAIEPETETAEIGWAGKELAFYRQGKNEEALCCYYKLKNIDSRTNLVEKSKIELLNSVSQPTASWGENLSWDGITESVVGGLLSGALFEVAKTPAVKKLAVRVALGITERAAGAEIGTILAPEIVVPAICVLTVYDVYTDRDEIFNAINGTFSETNSSTIIY